jgi:tetratricopeptide (TPR) repeat protein
MISVGELIQVSQPLMAASKFDEAEPYVMMALTMCDDPLGFYPKQKRDEHLIVLVMWVDIKIQKKEWVEAEKALLKLADFEDIMNTFTKLFVLKCLAATYQNLGKTDQLDGIQEKAQQIQPDAVLEWLEFGNVHAQLGVHNQAKEAYLKALDISPKFDEAIACLKVFNRKVKEDTYQYKCFKCGTSNEIPIFPIDTAAMMAGMEARKKHGETVDSWRYAICKKCGDGVAFAFTLCLKCFRGYDVLGVYTHKGEGRFEGKTIYQSIYHGCSNCYERTPDLEQRSLEEQELLKRVAAIMRARHHS